MQQDQAAEIELRCIKCPEGVIIGDDPARRAVWIAEFVRFEGWTETAEGLLCPCCTSEPHDLA